MPIRESPSATSPEKTVDAGLLVVETDGVEHSRVRMLLKMPRCCPVRWNSARAPRGLTSMGRPFREITCGTRTSLPSTSHDVDLTVETEPLAFLTNGRCQRSMLPSSMRPGVRSWQHEA